MVPLASLRAELAPGTRFVTPAERERQRELRARSYAWRLQDD